MSASVSLVRCPGCLRSYLAKTGERVTCICSQADPQFDEFDARGRLIRQRNARGQLVFQAAASSTLELWPEGPRSAIKGDPLDALTHASTGPSPVGWVA